MMGKMRHQNNANIHRRRRSSSSSSSIDSNTNSCGSGFHEYHGEASCSSSCLSSTNIHNNNYYCKDHLSTDLRLGLTLSHTQDDHFSSSSPRGQYSDWPPIKGHLRNTLAGKSNNHNHSRPTPSDDQDVKDDVTLFVKVYMQGLPIGRKLDLLSIDGYHTLISTLSLMFKTTILYPDILHRSSSENCHILTYEDKEGDWMMVGDVPWELFLTTVKRLKIVTLDSCQ